MKKRKITIISLVLCMLFAFAFSIANVKADTVQTGNWTRYQNSETNNGVTNRPGPTDEAHAMLLWEVGMENPTTPPLIVDKYIYTASGNYVYCFDKNTGEQIGEPEKLSGNVGDALQPMVYAEGKLFVTTNDHGTWVEAIDVGANGTLTYCWKSSKVQLGTCASPLSYHRNKNGNGYLYTGTWNGNQDGTYFCVSAATGTVEWSLPSQNRGFYWAGAYVTDDYVAFASESGGGAKDKDGQSYLYTVNALDGFIISQVPLQGTVRNTVVYDEVNNKGYLYVGTVAGKLYRVGVATDGTLAASTSSDFSLIDLGGPIKATTIVYNNKVYVGVEGEDGNPTYYKVVGCSEQGQLSLIDSAQVEIEPKGAPLLSTVEENNGILYFYYTCNDGVGGIYYFTVSNEGKILSKPTMLFTPENKDYCITSLALDEKGTLYYKNDSDYLMAVAPKLIQDVEVTPLSGIQWDDQRFEARVKNYNLTVTDSVSSLQFDVKKINGDNDVSWKFIVDGKEQGNTVTLDGETTKVELQVTRKAITQSYYFNIYKVTEQNTSLSLLYYGTNLYSGDNLLPPIEAGKTEYSVDLRKTSVGEAYLWIKTLHSNASVFVYAVENVKDPYTDKELKKGQELDRLTIEQLTGEYKFAVNPVDNSKNTVIRVSITSADKSTTQDYQLTFLRVDPTPNVTPPANQHPSGTVVSNQPAAQTTTSVTVPKPKKVSGLKSKKSKKKVTLTWKKVSGASGYQIILAKDKKFKKSKKQINISKASTCKKQIKLTAKTKYVRVRAYVKKNGTTVYGAYSKTLKIN